MKVQVQVQVHDPYFGFMLVLYLVDTLVALVNVMLASDRPIFFQGPGR
ncbi:MAG: hypothetical protein H7273_06660 [Polaromonas sp.]|nr:hypothetical protein [Polaromonas sp.]